MALLWLCLWRNNMKEICNDSNEMTLTEIWNEEWEETSMENGYYIPDTIWYDNNKQCQCMMTMMILRDTIIEEVINN